MKWQITYMDATHRIHPAKVVVVAHCWTCATGRWKRINDDTTIISCIPYHPPNAQDQPAP